MSVFAKSAIKLKSMANPVIGVCQMCVTNDKTKNFVQAQKLVEDCKRHGAVMAFLPEACDYISVNRDEAILMAEPISNSSEELCTAYSNLAKNCGIWLSLGGVHRLCDGDPDQKIRTTHIILDDKGSIQALYDKCHLFDVDIPSQVTLRETDRTVPGSKIVKPVPTPAGSVGTMICYDVRFPQISSMLREQGADILTYPSAFTVPTGYAHWEVLLRARAIENQCYVVAAAQVGKHNDKRTSYGHSLVVDPWGVVIAHASDKVGVITAEIDKEYLQRIRTNMPVLQHSRKDLYS